jgi:DNA-binding NarL/FixJ family response regulator
MVGVVSAAATGGGTVTIRVGIADDQALVRDGLQVQLGYAGGIEVVGVVADGRQAVELARTRVPDVLLMDVRMPVLDGLEATRRIVEDPATASVRVLVLTTFDLDELVYGALRAGASGFLLKDVSPEELVKAVRIVADGGALLAPQVTRRLIAEFATRPPAGRTSSDLTSRLTAREREVLVLVARGLSNGEIAARLVISPLTAKTHVSRILTKLGLRDRAQLVAVAYEAGLVVPGTS